MKKITARYQNTERTFDLDKIIIKYIRDESYKPIGCVVAIDRGVIGWSLHNPRDKWDRDVAIKVALGRALGCKDKGYPNSDDIPFSKFDIVDEALQQIEDKSLSYRFD